MMPFPASNKGLGAAIAVVSTACAVSSFLYYHHIRKKRRAQWQQTEEEVHGGEALHSILKHFNTFAKLDPRSTVEEANKRRTISYYEKVREAHTQELVLGVSSYSHLLQKRQAELDRILHYYHLKTHSHRTVICMCDETTQQLLEEARTLILSPLRYSTDIKTKGAWIPAISIIPPSDMHVTVATPWWWHTIRDDNEELSKELASRLKQTLLLKFHYAFQIELERIVLLGGKTLVALWRCVGQRTNQDGTIIYDRHGETPDPFVRLRVEIVRCFTTESPDARRQPLTYHHKKSSNLENEPASLPETESPPSVLLSERQHTIESKTPGLGAGDGFIHTTLARIPTDCLSSHDMELHQVHRNCREATATLSGHRMVVSKFRVLETTGCGGESNPCVEPLFDETIDAPTQYKVEMDGAISKQENLHIPKTLEQHQTIGAVRNFDRPSTTTDLGDLFEAPQQQGGEEEEHDSGGGPPKTLTDLFMW